MIRSTQGVVHGRTIELVEDLGVAEGQRVEVQVTVIGGERAWGDSLKRCAGALSSEWTEEDEQILASIYHERKQDVRKEIRR